MRLEEMKRRARTQYGANTIWGLCSRVPQLIADMRADKASMSWEWYTWTAAWSSWKAIKIDQLVGSDQLVATGHVRDMSSCILRLWCCIYVVQLKSISIGVHQPFCPSAFVSMVSSKLSKGLLCQTLAVYAGSHVPTFVASFLRWFFPSLLSSFFASLRLMFVFRFSQFVKSKINVVLVHILLHYLYNDSVGGYCPMAGWRTHRFYFKIVYYCSCSSTVVTSPMEMFNSSKKILLNSFVRRRFS